MARVTNQLINVQLTGPARVKQYFGTGPLMVKLPGERGEVRAASGDYVLYEGDSVVGVVGGTYLDALREDKDTLVEEEVSTGAHVRVIVTSAPDPAASLEGAPLPNEPVFLKQGGVQIATGMTDDAGEVYFNVLPGKYSVGPQNAAHGPEVEVDAVVGDEEAPPDPPITREGGGPTKVGDRLPHVDNSLPRFNADGMPDPKGNYDGHGNLIGRT